MLNKYNYIKLRIFFTIPGMGIEINKSLAIAPEDVFRIVFL